MLHTARPRLLAVLMLGLAASSAATATPSQAAPACDSAFPPLIDLSNLASFYKNTASQSTIDPEAYDYYISKTKTFDGLLKSIVSSHSAYSAAGATPEQKRAIADCLLQEFARWANRNALLVGVDNNDPTGKRQAVLLQTWAIVAVTSGLAEMQGDLNPASKRYRRIVKWIKALAWSVHHEFQPSADRPKWLNQTANHSHWAGLAQARAGLLVKDPRLVAAGMAELDRALDAVEPNGALPREMARGERSLHYMNFALLPIAGLVRIADETGYALTPARQAAFVRLVRFTYGADMDPKDFETLVGQAQMAAEPGVDLAWVPVALPSLEPLDVALAAQIRSGTASLGRLESRFYGPQAQ